MSTLDKTISKIRPLDTAAMEKARLRQDDLIKPRGSLGRLEQLSIHLAGITGNPVPQLKRKAIITMAADHGVALSGVSLYPREVTQQMVMNFVRGGAAINILAEMVSARVVVVDMGICGGTPPGLGVISRPVDLGTADMSLGPAMTRSQALDSLQAGIEITSGEIQKGLDIVGTGDMGIGNTTAASAITATVTGLPVAAVTGRGTGIGDEQLSHKVKVIQKALENNRPDAADAIDILSKVGGFEIGGLAGLILAAAANRIPVMIDGFISGAAALIACGICPQARDYLVAAHLSVEIGHGSCLRHLELNPLLDLNLRLGEGTGAALGIYLADAAVNLLGRMATFSEAGVSDIQ